MTELGFDPLSLPFVDEHTRRIDAGPDAVWAAIARTLRRRTGSLAALARSALGVRPSRTEGPALATGSTVPGFRVVAAHRLHEVLLAGRHHGARYSMAIRLTEDGATTVVRVETRALFPGKLGRLMRVAILGSHGHQVAVRAYLTLVARRSRQT